MTDGISTPEVSDENTPEATADGRLRDLEFSDLYLSSDRNAFIREKGESNNPLSAVPAIYATDLEKIAYKVEELAKFHKEFFIEHDEVRYRVAIMQALRGTWYVLRKTIPVPSIHDLHIKKPILKYLSVMGTRPGLFVIAGPTGSGKSTTASALLRHYLENYGDVAVTLEEPPEIEMEGEYGEDSRGVCFQRHITDGDFGRALIEAMRHNPRFILLGEVRAKSEAAEAVRAAINGHTVITTIHAGGVLQALDSMIKLAASQENQELIQSNLANGLMGVMSQQLIPDRRSPTKYRMKLNALFVGNETGVQAKLRNGNIAQLRDDMQRQAQRVVNGYTPTDY